jgi:acyl carrier protein
VVDRADPRGETRLVAYLESGDPPDLADLRAFLAEHVPNYMVPSAFVTVAELPHTPNGKVDRDALPEPEWDRTETAAEAAVAPRTPTESRVAEIFAEVLKVDAVGAHDNFFALGGHSLLAMQVVSRLRSEFSSELTLRVIFDTPTVSGLATQLESAAATPAAAEPAIVRIARPTSNRPAS